MEHVTRATGHPPSDGATCAAADGHGGLRRFSRRCRAFTLVELMATVVVIAALTGIALPRMQDTLLRARIDKAIGDIRALQADLVMEDSLPASLAVVSRSGYTDPWGNAYVYFPFPDSKGKGPPNGARRDRFLVPVNSEYDLYSMGADGKTAIAFTAKNARDDVVRASDGAYIGLASKY